MLRLTDFIIAKENGIYPSELIILFAIKELNMATNSNEIEISRDILSQIAKTNYTGDTSFFGEKTKELIDKGFVEEVDRGGTKGLITSKKFDELFSDKESWFRELFENYPKTDNYNNFLRPAPSTSNRVLIDHYFETIKGDRELHTKSMKYLKDNIQYLKDESLTLEKFLYGLHFK